MPLSVIMAHHKETVGMLWLEDPLSFLGFRIPLPSIKLSIAFSMLLSC